MIALLFTHAHIFWLTLGGLLLAAEMLGASGYLLWSGVAAVLTGLLVWIVPLGWEWQGVCFAATSPWHFHQVAAGAGAVWQSAEPCSRPA